ncbi:RNA polymerase sigma factor [Paraburkholderia lacunae]|uniref:RNA polymerase sigma factor n=1 Tax=Paraburkholderia lacunae TaxID=2211104 RepID=A0A370NDP7_9BURK|nr:RNA polymerase sigma factor [Paraburkholderia lacunae]RDK03719.1 RNA polymerase sigma factor [Paraburkholderia lacunae]
MVQTDSHAVRARDDADADPDAMRSRRFQQLALPHLDAAYNLARWLCGNSNDADDVVQEAFMRAFRFFDTFRGETARPWLLAIVRRTWYTEWRRRASSLEVVEFDDSMDDATFEGWSAGGADPQTLLIRDEDAKLVHEALAQLPVEYREVLILRELEEMGYREIAMVADVPIGTVMSRLARGRRKLAALLTAPQGGGQPVSGVPASAPSARGAPRPAPRACQADPNDSARGAGEGGTEPGGPPRAAMSAARAAPTASVSPLRAVSNARPSNAPGASAAGPTQETPDGL